MKKIYFATKNKGKASSVGDTLSKYGILLEQVELDLPESRTYDLQEIAREKVLFAYGKIKKPCIALDAGFYVHSLNGFPKTYVNFALETIGIEGILRLVDGKSLECEFRNCLAYMDGTLAEPVFFESRAKGRLSDVPRGETENHHWSKLFLIFIPKEVDKTLAEMSFEEFQEWRKRRSRDSSARGFAEWFSKR